MGRYNPWTPRITWASSSVAECTPRWTYREMSYSCWTRPKDLCTCLDCCDYILKLCWSFRISNSDLVSCPSSWTRQSQSRWDATALRVVFTTIQRDFTSLTSVENTQMKSLHHSSRMIPSSTHLILVAPSMWHVPITPRGGVLFMWPRPRCGSPSNPQNLYLKGHRRGHST